ncbi:gamma-glutamyl-gamma-aminobutyrate hydrolase family protein [Magnetovibrio sp.]|uniref:gamma-glutamyl-gamma-aminobutyrate hydrolase family protein n=1 Tax=Magnetovibrio sp. TaxID=2024836 RepID=UPI002F94909C
MRSKPIVAVSACVKNVDGFPNYAVGTKYVDALAQASDVTPLILPAIGYGTHAEDVLEMCDGLYLTGSVSNVEPHHYDGEPSEEGTLHDPLRDATTLPLIRRAVESGVPVFAICRGFQEMNVAFGGALYQKVHTVSGMMDHREDREQEPDVYFGPAHDVDLVEGGLFADIAGTNRITVNSLHGQGVQRLASNLEIEARAPDGLIEAFRVKDAQAFAVGVQWHPEWKVMDNTFSRALFERFGQACRKRASQRNES